jgi:hypothetical protein
MPRLHQAHRLELDHRLAEAEIGEQRAPAALDQPFDQHRLMAVEQRVDVGASHGSPSSGACTALARTNVEIIERLGRGLADRAVPHIRFAHFFGSAVNLPPALPAIGPTAIVTTRLGTPPS